MKEYIEYLKSFDNKEINEAVFDFYDGKISDIELERVAIKNDVFTKNVYEKCFKLGRLLKWLSFNLVRSYSSSLYQGLSLFILITLIWGYFFI